MLIRFGIPILAAAALGFGGATTMILRPEEQLTSAPSPPAASTLSGETIAGLGELQPPGEPIAVGTPVGGIVQTVYVTSGDRVRAGDPLFSIDGRSLRAELALMNQGVATAEARLKRLQAGSRAEDIRIARARRESALAAFERASDLLARAERIEAQNAISVEEMLERRFRLRETRADLEAADAELARLEAGSWQPDIRVAERELDHAREQVARVQTELDRLTIRAGTDATVLRVDIREGEYIEPGNATQPPVVLGRVGPMQVRVQIDEEDASRLTPGAHAEGFVRGRDRVRVELSFVRIEPRVVPKVSLTGATTERVDTRVLYAVYETVKPPEQVYTGQKLDVFIGGGAR